MMYTFPNKLRNLAITLMVAGFLGLTYGFLNAPSTLEESKSMVSANHGDGHSKPGSGDHGTISDHQTDSQHDTKEIVHDSESTHSDSKTHQGVSHDLNHDEHVFHQLSNKPWAAFYVAPFFFFMISLGVLAFYAIQRAAQAGWSPVLFRVMEGITAYLLPGYLNVPFFMLRAVFFLSGWSLYRYFSRKFSLAQDSADDISNHKKNYRISAAFLVFFIVTESVMSWDWIMSIDPHWFSTLFGWYVFASMVVSGVTTIALITIYLKSKGFLEFVNDSHIHDLGKFMFGFSVFWTYLWFSQFMLIWYSNIPEEVTYFMTRIEDYNLPFFGMLVMNFIFPLLILMNSDYKRINYFIVMAGIVILLGHYIDVYNMIMPSAVGDQWYIGTAEIGGFLFFLGLFIFIVFKELTKSPLLAKGDPYIGESKRFHY